MAKYIQSSSLLPFTAAAQTAIGALIQIGGLVGIVGPKHDGTAYEVGDLGAADTDAVVELDNSGVVFSAGDMVGYDATADNAVATTLGDFDCGTALAAAGSTEKVRVVLNAGL